MPCGMDIAGAATPADYLCAGSGCGAETRNPPLSRTHHVAPDGAMSDNSRALARRTGTKKDGRCCRAQNGAKTSFLFHQRPLSLLPVEWMCRRSPGPPAPHSGMARASAVARGAAPWLRRGLQSKPGLVAASAHHRLTHRRWGGPSLRSPQQATLFQLETGGARRRGGMDVSGLWWLWHRPVLYPPPSTLRLASSDPAQFGLHPGRRAPTVRSA